ncbi:hypothetical protein EK904_004422 [Melospiza melodia maxima]|nr:hypothetical protein EK904_004422 [Melospiza melodia maxima]
MMPPEEESPDGDRDSGLVLLHGPKSGSTRKLQRSRNNPFAVELLASTSSCSESISVPMIPLGLKETKELDLLVPLKDFISEHYGEEGVLYEKEIKEFMELRQLYFLDSRFFPPSKTLGVFFHWYDSLTGVPSHQRALAFEKGSVLFNLGALHTQIGARQDRASLPGLNQAIDAFQQAAGAFNYLKENFSNAPSLDMSAASLTMLVRLMVAQVQECVFEKMTLLRAQNDFLARLQLAQEAARVEDVYSLVHQTMSQPHVKDYVPFSWTTMVQVKSEHFKALSHYFAAIALCDCPGKAHLKKAIMKHEEAMRIHGLCKILRKMDILQEGPLSVFSAKNKWYPARRVHLVRGENGFGFTLRGDSPVLIAGVIPGGCAAGDAMGDGGFVM